jgi:N-acetyl sugar amidotransferase
MNYCKRCTYPIVAVNLSMRDDGICSGCITHDEKLNINWTEREEEFKNLLFGYKERSNGNYDCIIPVSGGKDSHYQAWYVKKLGLNPLLVTYYTHNYTETGESNLKNISDSLGLDHYVFTPSKHIIAKMNKIGFEMTGDMSWHFHCGAWTVPFQIGVKFDVPLLIYGEHGFTDLAGQYSMHDKPEFTKRARKEDVLRGYSASDFIGKEGLTEKDLLWTQYPSDAEIERTGLRGIFMGNYVYWDANKHLKVAQECGFQGNPKPFERTYRLFSNVDDIHENGIKDYMKFVKFGYGRATDHTSKDIRLGYMSRDEGISLVKKYDHVKPRESLEYFLNMVGMTEIEFDAVADKFRDPSVWRIENGLWWKETLWGKPNSYGKVMLPLNEQLKYKV